MRNLNLRKQLKEFSAKKKKPAKNVSKSKHDGSYNKKMFPTETDYSGKLVTPGYDPKKAAKYKKNAKK
jgi:hypothetical protein